MTHTPSNIIGFVSPIVVGMLAVGSRDGYAVAISSGELAPEFENKSVIIATQKDGKPLSQEDGVRLIIPGDKHGGRAVRDVVKIDVQ